MKKEIKTFRERLKKANKTETERRRKEDAMELEMQEDETKKRKEEDARREAADRALAGVFEKERKRLEKIEREQREEEEEMLGFLRERRRCSTQQLTHQSRAYDVHALPLELQFRFHHLCYTLTQWHLRPTRSRSNATTPAQQKENWKMRVS